MTDADSQNDKEDLGSQTLLIPTKKLCFKEVERILKSPKHSRKKESKSSKSYFKPRSNVKPTKKRDVFGTMEYKIYLQLSLPIAIQQINEYEATETKTPEAITAIQRVLTSSDSRSIILAWQLKVEETIHPLKFMDCIKTLTKRPSTISTSNYFRWGSLPQIQLFDSDQVIIYRQTLYQKIQPQLHSRQLRSGSNPRQDTKY